MTTDVVPEPAAKPPADPAHIRPEPAAAGPGYEDGPGKEIKIGAMVAGAFFVLFLGWAAVAPLDAGAYAPGTVVVSGNRQAVQHRDGGVVNALHVREGDMVVQGQILVEIAANELRATERALTAQVLSLRAQRARLIAERDGLPALVAPFDPAALPPEDRLIAEEALRMQVMQLNARRQAMATQRTVLNQRVGQLNQQITGFGRQVEANSEQSRLIQDELDGMRKLEAQGYAPKTRVRALERAAAGLKGDDGAFRAEMARAREAIGETRAEMVMLDRRHLEEVVELLRQTEVNLGELEPKLAAARQQLDRALVRAPATGRVVGLSAHTVGGVVAPGQTLMEIVPEKAPLVIEAMVDPADADDLKVGQTTEVRLVGIRERGLPILKGEVTKISADSFLDEQTGMRFFKAEVSVPPETVAELVKVRGVDTGLKPGIPAEVVVPLRKRTALQYMFEPLQQTVWRSFREH